MSPSLNSWYSLCYGSLDCENYLNETSSSSAALSDAYSFFSMAARTRALSRAMRQLRSPKINTILWFSTQYFYREEYVRDEIELEQKIITYPIVLFILKSILKYIVDFLCPLSSLVLPTHQVAVHQHHRSVVQVKPHYHCSLVASTTTYPCLYLGALQV